MADAPPQELSKLESAVADFKSRFEVLNSIPYGAAIARTGDNALMLEFGETLAKAQLINRSIDAFANRYQGAKEFLGLAALPLIPILVVAGITATVLGGVTMVDRFMRKAGVAQIQQENPGISYEAAASRYENIHQSTFSKALDVGQLAIALGLAVVAYLFISR